MKQNLDEIGLTNIQKKLKLYQINRNSLDYSIRTRKVSDKSISNYFYKIIKKIYLSNNNEGLDKVY